MNFSDPVAGRRPRRRDGGRQEHLRRAGLVIDLGTSTTFGF
ncbi:MAG: hypothetical protein ACLSDQ_00685 [Adlercreutzia equolifaciens]